MIDESLDTEFIKTEPQPWEFRSKPLWARVFVISAGVLMNVLLAIAIFWGINYVQGKYLRATTEIGYVIPESAADRAGLRAGDKIVNIDGEPVTHWDAIESILYLGGSGREVTLEIERSGTYQTIVLPAGGLPDLETDHLGVIPAHTVAMVGGVEPGKPAETLGLQQRDILVSLNGIPVFDHKQVVEIVQANAGREIEVVWKRGEEIHRGKTTPTEEGRIGITVGSVYVGPTLHMEYSFFGALPAGLKDIVQTTGLFYRSIVQLITGRASFSQSFGGPIKIAQIATQSAEGGLISFLAFMAILSMSLAILNILPFPVLDGGHLVMMLLEAVFRREIPYRVKVAIQQIGFVIIIVFMAFVLYNDIVNF
jgi:regulator of sigma E protease